MAAIVKAEGVSVLYPRANKQALDDVTLEVKPGDAIGIVGESGSGKSTLARVLIGITHPTDGSALLQGAEWGSIRPRDERRRRVQMIFQDPYGSLNPRLTARQTVAEVFHVWERLNRAAANKRAGELLQGVGLSEEAIDRRPQALSGGQCQRVGIARALACSPDVLIADEPTSGLDVSVQAQVLNLLATLRKSRGLSLVLISHDLGVIQHATDRCLVLYGGQVVESGPTSAVFSRPLHPYTRILVDSIPGNQGTHRARDGERISVTGCVFRGRCPQAHELCAVARPPIVRESEQDVACVLYGASSAADAVTLR
jgi:oligopeptide/dipeptide ABC transporter ATP-binding protein